MQHATFHYPTIGVLKQEAEKLHAFLPLSSDMSALFHPLTLGTHTANNRIAFQPMEGTDGTEGGAPGEYTIRRYHRFAKAGPGLIWFEAVATVPEGRASVHQLFLSEKNVSAFHRLTDEIREISLRENGYAPVIVMQATNSGRYSKPHGFPEPMIAYSCPPLEDTPLPADRIVSDDDLKRFEEAYTQTARLCQQAGFDGMDVKCCHRYLACELLSAYTRPGRYGGCFENRTRFLKNCYRAAKSAIRDSGFFLTSRMNVYDGFPYPFGFGVNEQDGLKPDLREAIRLISELKAEFQLPLINVTMGNPYKNPHVNRPYDHGNYVPDEHPLEGESRMMYGVSEIQHAMPELPVLGSAFSYLRQYAGNLAAGMVKEGHCAMAGFGRMAFADPDFVHELREQGQIDPRHVCITCGGCAALLRAGTPAGCIVRDREVYHL
ncbi:MAG: flavin oxidoreductase/NADH oxidase [Clostridiales bacterium]|nr:flavin oxidoreductase/NADH oxidase [Clostridiales bacterium]